MPGRHFSHQEKEFLKRCLKEGKSYLEISKLINRTPKSLKTYASRNKVNLSLYSKEFNDNKIENIELKQKIENLEMQVEILIETIKEMKR